MGCLDSWHHLWFVSGVHVLDDFLHSSLLPVPKHLGHVGVAHVLSTYIFSHLRLATAGTNNQTPGLAKEALSTKPRRFPVGPQA
jgi:hypothetical protein